MNTFIILSSSGIIAMLAGSHQRKQWGLPIVLAACFLAILSITLPWLGDYSAVLHNMLSFDKLSSSFSLVMVFLTIGILILSHYYYYPAVEHLSDIYALFMFSLAGGILLVSFQNFVMLFLGAEILSIPLYILAASHRRHLSSNEAGLKYYLMGSFATCFMLLGITLIYGASGTFDLNELRLFLTNGGMQSSLFMTGITLVFGTLLFKLSAVPFHFWAPDVYQGAPTVLTAFVSTVVKVAVAGAMIKLAAAISFEGIPASANVVSQIAFSQTTWFWLLVLASAASMLFGSIVALQQNDLKRFLAYTGIFNAGFVLLPVLSKHPNVLSSLLYYMAGYGVAAILCFTLYAELKKLTGIDTMSGLQGLLHKHKLAGVTMIVCLLSFTGIPPLAGFWGKFGILSLSMQSHLIPLVLVAILSSLIGAYNYIRIVTAIATPDNQNATKLTFHPFFIGWLALGTLLLIAMGCFPESFINLF
jgi:NADH-quinone oxidoreductase subunit N